MQFNFPRTKFVNDGGIVKQIRHINTEVKESHESALTPDVFHTAEELMDVIHSAESALRIMEEFHGVDLSDVKDHVIAKNRSRNYYAE